MSSYSTRDYYYTSNEGASRSRSASSHETLPSLRSVLGAQLDLPVKSGCGSYDLREMSKALPRPEFSSSSDYRSSGRSQSFAVYPDRDRDRDTHSSYRDQRSPTYLSSTSSATTSHSSTYKSRHEYDSGNGYQRRTMTPTYEEQERTHGSSHLDPSRMDRGYGNKKYACSWPGCEKRFERQNALDTHMNIHTEQKPYACPVAHCGKVFNVRSNMRRHLLTHRDCQLDEDEYHPVPSAPSSSYTMRVMRT